MINEPLVLPDISKFSASKKTQILKCYVEVLQDQLFEARSERDLALNQLRAAKGSRALSSDASRDDEWVYAGRPKAPIGSVPKSSFKK